MSHPARVSKDEIRARAIADPAGSYQAAGLAAGALRRVGAVLQCLCPFHADSNTPSFTLYPRDGHWHCFGCGKRGDLIDFYQAVHSVLDFKEACDQLGARLGIVPGVTPPRPRPTPAREVTDELPPISIETVEALHQALLRDAKKLAWLQERKGLTREIIADAKIGLGRGPCWREDRFTIPIMDLDRLDIFRDIRGYRPRGQPKVLAWQSGRGKTRLYPWPWVCRETELVWCEGELDCLNLISRGIAAVTATNGVDGALGVALPDLSGMSFVVIGDDDPAGDQLNLRLPTRLYAAGARMVKALRWEEVVGDA